MRFLATAVLCMNRCDSLPVSTMWQWCVSLSSSAVVRRPEVVMCCFVAACMRVPVPTATSHLMEKAAVRLNVERKDAPDYPPQRSATLFRRRGPLQYCANLIVEASAG